MLLGTGLAVTLAFCAIAAVQFTPIIVGILEDLPMSVPPVDDEITEGEAVHFRSLDGVSLYGRYLRTDQPRRGVVIFSHEFGCNLDSGVRYCGFVRDYGFDLFTFDYRGHGRSGNSTGYKPRQWATDKELNDLLGAVAYVESLPEVGDTGIAVMGLSRGAGAAILAAARTQFIRALITDSAFDSTQTMVVYMRKWVGIFVEARMLFRRLPDCFYWMLSAILQFVGRWRFGCRFPSIERSIKCLGDRPILMIHGERDNYIPLELGKRLYDLARCPKEFWLVPKAKHNQSYLAGQHEYRRRIGEFLLQAFPAETSQAEAV